MSEKAPKYNLSKDQLAVMTGIANVEAREGSKPIDLSEYHYGLDRMRLDYYKDTAGNYQKSTNENLAEYKAMLDEAHVDNELFDRRERVIEDTASVLHDNWRASRKRDDGSYEPRVKVLVRVEGGKTKWVNEEKLPAIGDYTEVKRQDIANTPYADLDPEWQKDNRDSATEGLEIAAANPEGDIDTLASKVHDAFLARRAKDGGWVEDWQKAPYAELPDIKSYDAENNPVYAAGGKEDDRKIVRAALATLESLG